MAQTVLTRSASSAHGTPSLGRRDRDRQRLVAIVTSILATPPRLPAWSEPQWRAALRYRDTGPRPTTATVASAQVRDAVLHDPLLGDFVRWAAARRPASYQLAAIAAAMAALGDGLADTTCDADRLARRVVSAVDDARPLRYRPLPDRAMLADPDLIADLAPPPERDRPSLVSLVLPRLLEQGGYRPSSDPVLARRIEAAVDVCLAVWLDTAQLGGGLPEFRRADERNHKHRLSHLLGADRDLHRLVEGPAPGRGRPLAVARRRGLAFWVVLALRSAAGGDPVPPIPTGGRRPLAP
jgi:hypothetical protein